jgi:hypothetical protein
MNEVVPQHERVERVISLFESEMYQGWPSAPEDELGISLVLSRLTLGAIERSDGSMEIWKWDGDFRYHADKCDDSECAGFGEPQYPLCSEGADCSEETFTYDRKLDGEDGSALRTYFARGDNVILGQDVPPSSELTGKIQTELAQKISLDVCLYRPEYRTVHVVPVDSLSRFHASGEDNPLCWGYHTRDRANETKMQPGENGSDTRCNPETVHAFEPHFERILADAAALEEVKERLQRLEKSYTSDMQVPPQGATLSVSGDSDDLPEAVPRADGDTRPWSHRVARALADQDEE